MSGGQNKASPTLWLWLPGCLRRTTHLVLPAASHLQVLVLMTVSFACGLFLLEEKLNSNWLKEIRKECMGPVTKKQAQLDPRAQMGKQECVSIPRL